MTDDAPWFDYTGQSLAEVVAVADTYRADSIVAAISACLRDRLEADGLSALSRAEVTVLAVNHFEEEISSGGFENAFCSTPELVPPLLDALKAVGHVEVAARVSAALGLVGIKGKPTAKRVEAAMEKLADSDDETMRDALSALDEQYYSAQISMAEKVLSFIRSNARDISIT
jgi:Domain of unknown function (DUF4375)